MVLSNKLNMLLNEMAKLRAIYTEPVIIFNLENSDVDVSYRWTNENAKGLYEAMKEWADEEVEHERITQPRVIRPYLGGQSAPGGAGVDTEWQ